MAKKIDHSKRAHAKLSPSGSQRWINCPPSANLEEASGIKDSTSPFAAEGTEAHELSEIRLVEALRIPKNTEKAFENFKKKAKFYSEEMEEEVEKYVEIAMSIYREALKEDSHARAYVEQKLDLTKFVPNGFGRGDFLVVGDGILDVVDLKYGKGIRVSAIENSQLRLYGLGAYELLSFLYDIHTVRIHIIQPRLDNFSTEILLVEDLLSWGSTTVLPAAKKAEAGQGQLKPGDHCRWCKVAPICKANAEANLEVAKFDFKDPRLLSDVELLKIYSVLPTVLQWASAVSKYVFNRALEGKDWPGYKLVEGRSQRKFKDEESAVVELELEGYLHDEIFNKKIKGLAELKKLLGASLFSEIIAPYLIKPKGNPTLVKESDKKPGLGIEQAKIDFK